MGGKRFNPLNLQQLEILNFRIQNLAAAPSAPLPGQAWFDTSAQKLMIRTTTDNVDLTDRAAHHGTQPSSTISDLAPTVQAYRLDQFAPPANDVSANAQRITNLATPTGATDACTRGYVDQAIAGVIARRLDEFAAPNVALSVGGQRVTDVAAPTAATDAATRGYVDDVEDATRAYADAGDTAARAYADSVAGNVAGYRLDQFGAPNVALSIGGQRLVDVAAPTAATDAASRGYVDAGDTAARGYADGLDAASRAYTDTVVAGVADNRLDEWAEPNTPVSLGTQRLINVGAPTAPTDAATRAYADAGDTAARAYADGLDTASRAYTDTAVAGVADNRLDEWAAPVGPVAFGGQRVTNVAAPTAGTDAANRTYVDAGDTAARQYADGLNTAARAYTDTSVAAVADNRLDEWAEPNVPVSLGTQRLINVGAPTAATDGATRGYVDAGDTAARAYADGLDAATRAYVDTSVEAVGDNRLDEFAAPNVALSIGGQRLINVAAPTAATDAATRGYVDTTVGGVGSRRLDEFAAPNVALSIGGQRLVDVAAPTAATDAATRGYVDAVDTAARAYTDTSVGGVTALRLDQFAAPTTALSAGTQRITNLAAPAAGTDATTRDYVDTAVAGVADNALSDFGAPTAPVSFGGQRLTNLATPTAPTDAATMAYVDNTANAITWKPAARVMAPGPITLAGLQTIAGIQIADGDRVLTPHQAAMDDRVIWIARVGAWERAPDAIPGTTLRAGATITITEGTPGADQVWRILSDNPLGGGRDIVWDRIGQIISYGAGYGLLLDENNQFKVNPAIFTRIMEQTIGDGAALQFVVPHNFGKRGVLVQVYQTADGAEIECDVYRSSINTVTLGFAIPPAAGSLNAVVVG
jgi:hypothetical protein